MIMTERIEVAALKEGHFSETDADGNEQLNCADLTARGMESGGEELVSEVWPRMEVLNSAVRGLGEEIVIKDCGLDEVNNPNEELVRARAVLPERLLTGEEVFLSPRFKCAAALAGWDDEALMLATQEEQEKAVNLGIGYYNLGTQEESRFVSAPTEASPETRSKECRVIHERKREERTPKQAVTPVSAGRRHRRQRRQSVSEQSIVKLPVEDLSLNREFQEKAKDNFQGASSSPSRAFAMAATVKTSGQTQLEDSPSLELSLADGRSCFSQARLVAREDKDTSVKLVADGGKEEESPACLEKLREELSCAVCLDICFEPSTTSCGHSFCRSCLQSVLQKCGPRCPKCRQPLKGNAWRTFPINTVLWNTIQILFAKESTEKAAAQKHNGNDAPPSTKTLSRPVTSTPLAQHSRPSSSSQNGIGRVNRPPPAGNFRTPFRPPGRLQRHVVLSDDDEPEGSTNYRREEADITEERRRSRARQEEIDAALANRLQQAELMQNTSRQSVAELCRELERFQRQQRAAADSATATNLPSLSSRAIRHGYRQRIPH